MARSDEQEVLMLHILNLSIITQIGSSGLPHMSYPTGPSVTQVMWSYAHAAAMVAAVMMALTAVMVVDAEPTYGRRPQPCYPKVHYVTQYQTKYKEVSSGGGGLEEDVTCLRECNLSYVLQ